MVGKRAAHCQMAIDVTMVLPHASLCYLVEVLHVAARMLYKQYMQQYLEEERAHPGSNQTSE